MVLKNYFDALPNEVMESARIDGAGKGKIFTSIMMPIAIPGLAFCSDSDVFKCVERTADGYDFHQ